MMCPNLLPFSVRFARYYRAEDGLLASSYLVPSTLKVTYSNELKGTAQTQAFGRTNAIEITKEDFQICSLGLQNHAYSIDTGRVHYTKSCV